MQTVVLRIAGAASAHRSKESSESKHGMHAALSVCSTATGDATQSVKRTQTGGGSQQFHCFLEVAFPGSMVATHAVHSPRAGTPPHWGGPPR